MTLRGFRFVSDKAMQVTKASGERERYAPAKVMESLTRSGVSPDEAKRIERSIAREITPGDSTTELFERVRKRLMETDIAGAARYSLKQAIMELGPEGYYFERYVAHVLEKYGYRTKTNQMTQGACVSHEIDIVAEEPMSKEKHSAGIPVTYLIEVKYHNARGVKTDVKEAMYAYARVLDVQEGRKGVPYGTWLVTNTKFTENAKRYGACRGVRLTGWRHAHPGGTEESLERLIEHWGLYPVTIFPGVSRTGRIALADGGVYFAYELLGKDARELQKRFGITEHDAAGVYAGVTALFGTHA